MHLKGLSLKVILLIGLQGELIRDFFTKFF